MISIHALVKRATFSIKLDTPLIDNFNPRPRKEGDTRHGDWHFKKSDISIHALVKRATVVCFL